MDHNSSFHPGYARRPVSRDLEPVHLEQGGVKHSREGSEIQDGDPGKQTVKNKKNDTLL